MCGASFVDTAAAVRPCRLVSGGFYDVLHTEREFHVSFGGVRTKPLFYAVMTRDHRLRYSNAGRCQPLLVANGTTVRRLGAGGTLSIGKGDTLVVFGDGASLADRDDRELGDARILDIVTRPAASAAAVRDRLVNAVTDFTRGSRQRDDMAVLVVRYLV
jgi:serine phosphatase RsbU (regulator of sigma subunit)